MNTEVVVTDEFEGWYSSLDEQDGDAVYRVVSLLESLGLRLGFPYSSAIQEMGRYQGQGAERRASLASRRRG